MSKVGNAKIVTAVKSSYNPNDNEKQSVKQKIPSKRDSGNKDFVYNNSNSNIQRSNTISLSESKNFSNVQNKVTNTATITETKPGNLFGFGEESVKVGNTVDKVWTDGSTYKAVDTESVMDYSQKVNEAIKANHSGKLSVQNVADDLFSGDVKAAKLVCGIDGKSDDFSNLDTATLLSTADRQFEESRTDGVIDPDEWQAVQKSLSSRELDESNTKIFNSYSDNIKKVLDEKGKLSINSISLLS